MRKTAMSESVKRDSWIDASKGIAMFGVMMIHSGANSLPGLIGKIGAIGSHGVQVFYVVSACLAFDSLERYYEKGGSEIRGGCRQWWIGKLVRLIPMYYLALFLYIIILREGEVYWLGSQGRISIMNMISHILLLHGLNPHYINSVLGIEWYLGNLTIFYFAAPFLYRKINNLEKSVCLCLTTALGAGLLHYASDIWISQTDAWIYEAYFDSFCIFTQLPVLALGIFLHHFLRRTEQLQSWKNRRMLSYCILLFSICMIWGEMYDKNQIYSISGYTLFALWSIGIMISQILYKSPLICNIFWQKIGQNSYVIYLFHWLIVKLYVKYMPFEFSNLYLDWGIRCGFALAVSYGAAICAERFINRPLVFWTQRLYKS